MKEFHAESKIYVAGHSGLVGSAIVENLKLRGYKNIFARTHKELDLTQQAETNQFFTDMQFDAVIVAAAKVGGILANSKYQADFLYDNLLIAGNTIHAAAKTNIKKLIFLGSSCIYPKFATQPITEESLLTGLLEETNEGYAIAKIAGLKLVEKYRQQYGLNYYSLMPTNMYGPRDNFHPEHSHVIPGLLRRFHNAKIGNAPEVTVWGSGTPKREFLFSEDLAEAIVNLIENNSPYNLLNVGTGTDVTIGDLAKLIAKTVGYEGNIVFDATKPDGTPRKVLNIDKILKTGWKPKVSLEEGLSRTYSWAMENKVLD